MSPITYGRNFNRIGRKPRLSFALMRYAAVGALAGAILYPETPRLLHSPAKVIKQIPDRAHYVNIGGTESFQPALYYLRVAQNQPGNGSERFTIEVDEQTYNTDTTGSTFMPTASEEANAQP